MFYDGHGEMRTVIHQSCNVIFWHFRELLLKDAFEPSQNDDAVAAIVIVDYPKFNVAFALLYYCRLQKPC